MLKLGWCCKQADRRVHATRVFFDLLQPVVLVLVPAGLVSTTITNPVDVIKTAMFTSE